TRIGHSGFNAVMREYKARGLADAWRVVIDETGGKECRLAAPGGRLPRRGGAGGILRFCAHGEAAAMKLRQFGAAVDTCRFFEQRPWQRIAARGRPVGERRNGTCEPAVAIRPCKLTLYEGIAVAACMSGAVTQHQMREIEIELMRRHIG